MNAYISNISNVIIKYQTMHTDIPHAFNPVTLVDIHTHLFFFLLFFSMEVSEIGRQLFTHRPGVKLNKVEFGSLKNQRAILQLQSGYCRLKEYQNKVGIADSPTCECGAIEDVQHFLLECPNYHVPRETLRQSLLLSCGIADFDTEILSSVTDDEDLKDIRP